MATLKYAKTCQLADPKAPSRTKIQGTSDALHSLGFDTQFDIDIEREADAIVASETELEKRLEAALKYAQARRDVPLLPCAYLEITKLIREDAEMFDKPGEEAYVQIAEVIAEAAARHYVKAEDVHVEPQEGQVLCSIDIHGGAWLLAVQETLLAATKDKGGGFTKAGPIIQTLALANGAEDTKLKIEPRWALDRVVFAAKQINEEHGKQLDDKRKQALLKHLQVSKKAHDDVWKEFFIGDEKEDADALLQKSPMSCFGGTLMSVEEGLKKNVREDQVRRQETNDLPSLMADAAQAQQQLKEALVPRTEWSMISLVDYYEVPYEDERRSCIAGSGCVAPGGLHFDPGIKGERHVFEKAKSCQRPEQPEPPVKYLVDIARLSIIFKTVKDINTALERILANLDVVFLENDFLNPNCLGYRCISVGVRQVVESRSHICTLKLHLEALFDVRKDVGNTSYQAVRSLLQSCGFKIRDLPQAQRAVLGELCCTRRQNLRSRELEFMQTRDAAETWLLSDVTENERLLLGSLINEVAEAAMSAGVPSDWVTIAADE